MDIGRAQVALTGLAVKNADAASILARLLRIVANEAAASPRFAKALATEFPATPGGQAPTPDAPTPAPGGPIAATRTEPPVPPSAPTSQAPRRRATSSTRAAAVVDPYAIFAESGEPGLRERLATLDVDQLKDVIAEYDMNYDKAAMRWQKLDRLIDRIVERTIDRAGRGSVLR